MGFRFCCNWQRQLDTKKIRYLNIMNQTVGEIPVR